MTATFADLVNDIQDDLYSFGAIRDGVTHLTEPLNDSERFLSVSDGSVVRKGFIEVDDELLEVAQSSATGLVNLHPWGRGVRGTVAAAHLEDARVVANPLFPKVKIKKVVNEVVGSLYPDLFTVVTDESIIYNPSIMAYAVPAAAEEIVSVEWKYRGPSSLRKPVHRWRFVRDVDLTEYPTGRVIELFEGVPASTPVRVAYKAAPEALVDDADLLTDAGLRESWVDLLRYGALYRLFVTGEGQRLAVQSAEASGRQGQAQPFQAQSVSKHYLNLYKMRVEEERRRLLNEHPGSVVRTA